MQKMRFVRVLDSVVGNRRSKTCNFDKLRAGSEPCRRIQNQKWAGFFAILVAFTLWGTVAKAQQPTKVARIGYLSSSNSASESIRADVIRLALRELGYIEGQSIAIEYRYAEGKL